MRKWDDEGRTSVRVDGEFIITAISICATNPDRARHGPPRPDCPSLSVSARICEFAMDTIAPLGNEPGLIAYECPKCGHVNSVLQYQQRNGTH